MNVFDAPAAAEPPPPPPLSRLDQTLLAHGHDTATPKLLVSMAMSLFNGGYAALVLYALAVEKVQAVLLMALAHYLMGLLVALLAGSSAALGFVADEHTPGRAHFAAELETMAWQGSCAWLLLGWVITGMDLLINPV